MVDPHEIESLTPREREILVHIGEGKSLPEIAQSLHRSLKTIESHRLSLGRKLNASNRVELAKIAIAAGLITVGQQPGVSADGTGAQQELAWLFTISDALRDPAPSGFIDALCSALTRVLGVRYAAVCMPSLDPGSTERCAVSYAEHGEMGEPYSYQPKNKPVQRVIDEGLCVVPSDAQQVFPEDELLVRYGVQSYVGIRLDDQHGLSAGVLAIAHDQPLNNTEAVQRVLRFFAARTVAELAVADKSVQIDELQRWIRQQSNGTPATNGDRPASTPPAEVELQWLQTINQAVLNTEGETFLKRFCDTASRLPGIDLAAICMPDPRRPTGIDPYHRYIVALSEHGNPGETIRYNAINTPCATTIEEGSCCFSEGIRQAYPDDEWLKQLNAESYIGLQLKAKDGRSIGGFGLIGKKPLKNLDAYRRAMDFFAPHLASALELSIEMDALRSQYDRLQAERVTEQQTRASDPGAAQTSGASAALSRISQRLHPHAGAGFLREIVDAVCETFSLRFAGICKLDDPHTSKKLTSMMFRAGDEEADQICYDATDTPCEVVLERGLLCLPDRAAEAFPGDRFLVDHNIEGFTGVRLPTPSGEIVGVMWVVDPEPLADPEAVRQVLQHFAPRVGAELVNFMQLETLLQEREWLQKTLSERTNEQPA